ncbi:uncharacterized [Tachysurus ichikawai]
MGSNPRVDKRSQVSIEKSPGILEEKSTLKQAGEMFMVDFSFKCRNSSLSLRHAWVLGSVNALAVKRTRVKPHQSWAHRETDEKR